MNAISVRDLRKSYGSFEALRGVTFEVATGAVVAVLGPNGAGKTTMIEILEGYRARDGGHADVLGMDPATGGSELRQRIGIVLQESGIDNYLTVREVLHMHAEYYHHPLPVGDVVRLVGLEEKAGAKVKSLSGGQRRRLDVGLGLIGDPELLFLDEPTTGFDPTARRQAWNMIAALGDLGKTVLLTTHYMEEAQFLADRVLVIAEGTIVADGAPESIGGRATAAVRIRFALPSGVAVADLPVAPTSVDAGTVLIETHDATEVLHHLTGWAIGRNTMLEGLTVDRPSLEDVYLALTGTGAGAVAT